MKTRFNLHNKCFLASRYHDLWDTQRIDKSKIYTSAYRDKLSKWRRLQFPWRSTVWQIKHEAGTNVSKYLMTPGLERQNTDRRRRLFGTSEACQFCYCQASGTSPKILEWRRECQDRTSRWDIRFFEVMKQNGGCNTSARMERYEKLNAHWRENVKYGASTPQSSLFSLSLKVFPRTVH